MTLADLITVLECAKAEHDAHPDPDRLAARNRAKQAVLRTMADAGLTVVRFGDMVFVRVNEMLLSYDDEPDASKVVVKP